MEGHKYGAIKRAIGTWNCRHLSFPIVVGVNKPIHSDKELQEIADRNTDKAYEVDGKKYTKYEVSQIMRKLESSIRDCKERIRVLQKSGDTEGARQERERLKNIKNKYDSVRNIVSLVSRPLNM